MYIVIELQTNAQGQTAALVNPATANRNAAESTYHSILAAAAISQVPKHAAIMVTDEGFCLMHDFYDHGEVSAE